MNSQDEWISNFNSTTQLIEDLNTEINDRNILLRNNTNTAKQNNIIRSRMATITNEIVKLEGLMSSFATSGKVTDKEFTRRHDLIANLKGKKERVFSLFKAPNSHQEGKVGRNQLFETSSNRPAKGRAWGKAEETDESRHASDQELLLRNQEYFQQQDESLDLLADAIRRQKEIGLGITSEVDSQNDMLDDLSLRTDQVGHR
eukprot:Sdes_comp18578_c0_seq1m8693